MTIPGQNQSAAANVILNANVTGYSQGMQTAVAQTGLLSRALDDVEHHLSGIISKTGHGLLHFSAHEFASLGVATGIAATFEKQLGTLGAQASVTGQSMGAIKSSVETSFNKFPVSRASVIALTETLTDLGVKGPAALNSLTQTFIKLGAATGEGSQQLATGLVQLSRLFGVSSQSEIGNYANALLTVSAKAGVSATGVLNFSQAIAPLARQAGIGTTAVLGISTAFSKAGADGFVAANTFNSMISQITQLSANGSPDLAKYANLIGVTTSQLKNMDKTTALTDIFEAINAQGPKAIDTLNRLGFDGVRSLSAIQAVASSGDLRTQIANALGASGDQNNLNKASKTAFGGLVDAGAQVRNTMTQVATSVGTPLLKPLTEVLRVVNMLVGGFNSLGPVAAIIKTLAGTFGLLAGAILLASSAASKLVLAAFIGRSGPVGSLRAGFSKSDEPLDDKKQAMVERPWNAPFYQLGQRARGGVEDVRGRLVDRRYSSEEQLRARDQAVVDAGGSLVLGRSVQEASDARMAQWADSGTIAQRIRGGAGRGIRGLINANTQFVHTAGMAGEDRVPGTMPQMAYQVQRLHAWAMGRDAPEAPVDTEKRSGRIAGLVSALSPQNRAYNESIGVSVKAEEALQRAKKGGALDEIAKASSDKAAALEAQKALLMEAKAADAAAFAHKGLAKQSVELGWSFTKLQVATAQTAVKSAAAGASGLLSTGGGMLKSLATGIGGIGALTIGVPLAMSIGSSINKKDKAATDLTDLNPITKYNDALGIASTHLATFTNSLDAASGAANPASSVTTLDQARTIPGSVSAQFANKGSSDTKITGLSKHDRGNIQAGIALGQSEGLTDPRQFAMFAQNLSGAGWSDQQINQVLGGMIDANGKVIPANTDANMVTLGEAANKTQGRGHFIGTKSRPSGSGNQIIEGAITAIGSQASINADTHSDKYTSQYSLDQATTLLATLGSKAGSGANQGAFGAAISELTTGGNSQAGNITAGLTFKGHGVAGRNDKEKAAFDSLRAAKTPQEQQKAVIDLLQTTAAGAAYLKNITAHGASLDPTQFASVIAASQGEMSDKQASAAKLAGGIGRFATTDKAVLGALAAPSDPLAQSKGMYSLLAAAEKAGGSLAGTSAELDKLQGAIKDTSDPLYQLAAAAKSQLETNTAQFVTPGQSGTQQLASSRSLFQEKITAHLMHPTDDTKKAMDAAQANYASELIAQKEFEVQAYEAQQSYQIQTARAEAAYLLQRQYAIADFYTQQLYAQHDYNLQVQRQQQDYNTQMQRQAQSSAQSIYDPFARVQAKYTMSASTLLQNLSDQTQRIAQQRADLIKLKKMGISQQSIDTLNLADPNNAQQTAALVSSLASDPKLIALINSSVASRLKTTTALTQSTLSMSFRNTTADFKLQISRGATDFATATTRAITAQNLALSRMSTAFNLAAANASQDFSIQMGQMINSLDTKVATAVKSMPTLLNQLPVGLAKSYKDAFALIATDAASTARLLARAAQGGDSRPGEMGINPDGLYGSYSAKGVFTPIVTVMSQEMRDAQPLIVSPTTGHAAGGISTMAHIARVSEHNKSEAIIPLDARGLAFMAGFATQVSMAMVRQMHTSAFPMMPSGAQSPSSITYTIDQGNTFSGAVTVQATDPDAMAKALAAKARLRKLSSPARSSSP